MNGTLRCDPRTGLVRGVRAAVLTAPAVGAAGLAHGLVDGCGSPMAIAVATGICWPAAVAVLSARRRVPALAGWLLAAQLVTHVLLEWMCTDAGPAPTGLLARLQESATAPMLAGHVGAALVAAALLARADAGLWAAQALIRAGAWVLGLAAALTVSPVPARVRPAPVVVRVPARRTRWKSVLPARRGPPGLPAC